MNVNYSYAAIGLVLPGDLPWCTELLSHPLSLHLSPFMSYKCMLLTCLLPCPVVLCFVVSLLLCRSLQVFMLPELQSLDLVNTYCFTFTYCIHCIFLSILLVPPPPNLSLSLSFSQPNRSTQKAAHHESGSVQGFYLLKGSFSLPLSPSACSCGICWVSVNNNMKSTV